MRIFLVALALLSTACVSAHPAEYASKHWGCPEARIKVDDAHAQGTGGHAYAVTGCGKKMIVECVYGDNDPDSPYECTSRDEGDIAAASAPTSPASAPPPESSSPSAGEAPAPLPAPATMIAPATSAGGARYIASDGRAFPLSDRDAKTSAIAASGAFDLACAPAGVTASILYTADLGKPVYIAEGCGQRATYVLVRRAGSTPEVDIVLLTSVVPVKSASPSP